MGVKLLILLGLVVGALYSLHLLAQDFQAIRNPARFLFKRDLNSPTKQKPIVRWKKILQSDPLTCGRSLFCEIGTVPEADLTEMERGFIFMIKLEPSEEDREAHKHFIKAFELGNRAKEVQRCRRAHVCPFAGTALLDLVHYLITHKLL